jgi:hypothetical protein
LQQGSVSHTWAQISNRAMHYHIMNYRGLAMTCTHKHRRLG